MKSPVKSDSKRVAGSSPPPCSALVVFRVQDRDGRGPWKPGFSHKWVEDRDDHENLPPWYVDLGRPDMQAIAGMAMGSACRTLDQLRRWFTESEYRTLRRYGYRAVQMEVGRIIAESNVQCFVERVKPFRTGWKPVDLYPQNERG